jgi:hypothetical protein
VLTSASARLPQAVTNDYHRSLAMGMDDANKVINAALLKLMFSDAQAGEDRDSAATATSRRRLHSSTLPQSPAWWQLLTSFLPAAARRAATSASSTSAGAGDPPALELTSCELLNASICGPSVSGAGSGFMAVAYNPLAWEREEFIRLPVGQAAAYSVKGG